jgi:hypothetical protein
LAGQSTFRRTHENSRTGERRGALGPRIKPQPRTGKRGATLDSIDLVLLEVEQVLTRGTACNQDLR